ncbi:unnamed protein product [Rotaria sordida]|uniref:Potassium channel domain-containing protein n=1 Tax=Rotaria sordida TaxID=392033 RepID=A0A814BE30_9BILA|nr:unnamed protein product [Rotaria sordida]
MSASRYAVVRRLSRVLLLPLHGHTMTNDSMRRRKIKDSSSTGDHQICARENCLRCCKKFAAFMFSRVGLFFVMIGYVALGGWLFQALEAGNEQDMRRSMNEKFNSTLYKLWDGILQVNSYPYNDKKGNFTLYATQELEKFEATVIQQIQQGFDGRTRPGADPDWNFFGAILYAVTLVSTIGYGHITTKTIPGKVATVLYSAFGVPLMMLFVANIGSTMAKLFAFVFSRIKMLFCCQWKNKKRRKSLKQFQQKNNQISIKIDEEKSIKKSNLKQTKDDQEIIEKISINNNNNNNDDDDQLTIIPLQTQINLLPQHNKFSMKDTKQLPADVRLDMLTGVPIDITKSHSLTSSISTIGERSKDALFRINELIRQNSVQDIDNSINDEVFNDNDILLMSINQDKQQRSNDISPIQFYINETNKLTNNLENSLNDQIFIKSKEEKPNITNLDDMNIQQAIIREIPSTITTTNDDINKRIVEKDTTKEKSSKEKLKRSKSESTYNRKSYIKTNKKPDSSSRIDNNEITKSTRRRFFLRKLKKRTNQINEININNSLEQESNEIINETTRKLGRKSLSFDEHLHSLPPPPNYEESTIHDITSLPMVTWKSDNELYSTKPTLHFPTTIHTENDDDNDELYEDEQMTVPLLVTVFVIPLYLTLGAILFNIWERWGFLNSFYFCFTTLTTIGFGDYVPGASITVLAAKEKLICASLYILLGLVLIAMCFNLMKEQLIQKVKQIAGKWGILQT